MTESLEAQRQEIVEGMTRALARLAKARHFLNEAQRLAVSNTLRDVADCLDAGVAERSQRRCCPAVKRLVVAGRDVAGRPLFRIAAAR